MPRILVIDDEEDLRIIYRTFLESEGFEVEEAADGKIGLKLFRNNPTDLVITDILMPEKEGLETIRELKQEFPDLKIITVSGGGSIGHPEKYLKTSRMFGAARSLKKPVKKNDLLATVHELIGHEA